MFNKSNLLKIILISSAFFLINIASAQTWYIGGGIGRSHASVSPLNFPGNPSVHKWATGGKGFIGYQFNDNLGLEFSYIKFGDVDITGLGEIGQTTLTFEGVGIIPIDKLISIGATAGLYHIQYRADQTLTYIDNIDRSPVSGYGFAYGAFIQYLVEENAYARASFDQIINRGNAPHMRLNHYLFSINLVLNLGDTYD